MCQEPQESMIKPEESSTQQNSCDSERVEERTGSPSPRYEATIVVKGSADGVSSSELKRVVLVKKDTATPWYSSATPVRSNGRSHPLEIR